MSYTYEALSPGGHQEMLEEVFSKVREQVGSYKTASGSLVSFSDGADLPMPSFVCNIDAVQDLHGYDTPWVGGAGKNKAEPVENNWSNKGITATKNDDGSYSITGTATENVTSNFLINVYPVSAGKEYIVTNRKNQTDTATKYTRCVCSFYNDSTYKSEINVTEGQTITVPSNVNRLRLSYVWYNGFVVPAGAIIYPMIRLATETDPTFAPYSNICPISGHTGVDAWVRGKNLANPATVTTLYPTGDSGTYPNQIRSSSNARSFIAEVSPNTTYTISKKAGQRFRLAFTAEEPANGVADMGYEWNDTGTTITVTSPSNAKYMVVLFWSANVDTDTEEDMLATVQIEIGETASTYTPYNSNSQNIQVSWQTEAGEVFGGYVDLVSGELTVTHKEITYDGVTSGKMFSSRITGSNNAYYHSLPDGFDFNTTGRVSSTDMKRYGMINSHYDYTDDSSVGFYAGIGTTTGYLQPRILFGADSDITTVELANQWLATQYANGTPWQVVYPLATPLTYQLTPTQIKSLLGENNAWCSTGSIKSLQYQPNNIIAELRGEILALQARVEELEEQTEQTE